MNIRQLYIDNRGRSGMLALAFMLFFSGFSWAQADKKFIRQGNKEYEKNKFSESEIYYRKAIDRNKESSDALFNAGDALYKQKKYADAGNQFIETHKMNEDKDKKSASMYNLGNSLLMTGKVKESIDAYKNSLKLKPDNLEAKYNLAYAQDLLKKQQEQQKKNDKQDQKRDQDKKDDENKDQDQKQKKQEQQENKQQQQNQQEEQSISKEDAERLLNAIANDEKNVQEKVKLAKAAKARIKTLKNW
jgi:Ca-activated chloride channel family protein